uniref:Uncharacterized protein n=1 Tax=Tanacetum cinerariifolium TaxID=118510 RepID=A0A6L2K567_TANCI|nr:hypothetical protein [Tanacetum cinerariifolium]
MLLLLEALMVWIGTKTTGPDNIGNLKHPLRLLRTIALGSIIDVSLSRKSHYKTRGLEIAVYSFILVQLHTLIWERNKAAELMQNNRVRHQLYIFLHTHKKKLRAVKYAVKWRRSIWISSRGREGERIRFLLSRKIGMMRSKVAFSSGHRKCYRGGKMRLQTDAKLAEANINSASWKGKRTQELESNESVLQSGWRSFCKVGIFNATQDTEN